MTEQIGKIEKPLVEHFKQGKKVYLVPLVYAGEGVPSEYKEKCTGYWRQVEEQLTNLETKVGKVKRIYHESISLCGDEGMKIMEKSSLNSFQIAKSRCEDGAILEAIEDRELLAEVTDWERCLLLGITSEQVAGRVFQFYLDASKKRYEFMSKKMNETLKEGEAGLLFIREGHSLQFPNDAEVFSVFPPALDEIHRWLRDRAKAEETKD
jgi:hypothetical protein